MFQLRISDCGFKKTRYIGGSQVTDEKIRNPKSEIRN
jgi:hypothetical protein